MAITVVGTNSSGGSVSGGVSTTISVPTGATTSDFLLLVSGVNGGTTYTGPTGGWTTVTDTAIGGMAFAFSYMYLTGAPAASYSFSWSAFYDGGWALMALRGVDSATPVLGHTEHADSGGATTATVSAVTWAGAADAVSLIAETHQGSTYSTSVTYPGSWTSQFASGDGATEASSAATNLTTQSAVTTLGSQSLTYPTAQLNYTTQIALKVSGGAAAGSAFIPSRMPLGV